MASVGEAVHGRVHIDSCPKCGEVTRTITRSPNDKGNPLIMEPDGRVYISAADGRTPRTYVFLPLSTLYPLEIFTKSSGVVDTRTVLDELNQAKQYHLPICPLRTNALAKELLQGSKSEHKKD